MTYVVSVLTLLTASALCTRAREKGVGAADLYIPILSDIILSA